MGARELYLILSARSGYLSCAASSAAPPVAAPRLRLTARYPGVLRYLIVQ